MKTCPCGNTKKLEECCQPFIDADKEPATPEELMRSRYTAFYLKNMDYIYDTTDPQKRSDFDLVENQKWADSVQFTLLEILNSSIDKNKGTVEFKAHFTTEDKQTHIHHELAKFRKMQNVWYFQDGRVFEVKPPA